MSQGMSNHHMAQFSASSVQRPLYGAQHPRCHHGNILQRTMSRCIIVIPLGRTPTVNVNMNVHIYISW
jgi:hypothetical protein